MNLNAVLGGTFLTTKCDLAAITKLDVEDIASPSLWSSLKIVNENWVLFYNFRNVRNVM